MDSLRSLFGLGGSGQQQQQQAPPQAVADATVFTDVRLETCRVGDLRGLEDAEILKTEGPDAEVLCVAADSEVRRFLSQSQTAMGHAGWSRSSLVKHSIFSDQSSSSSSSSSAGAEGGTTSVSSLADVAALGRAVLDTDGGAGDTPVAPCAFASREEDRGVGVVLGMVVGDALGAPLEFQRLTYDAVHCTGMADWRQQEVDNGAVGSFCLKAGQWTDDASMGLCIMDSLLVHGKWNPADCKIRFVCWWELGYNNAFRDDDPVRDSVGLGGNIGGSLTEFRRVGTVFCQSGDRDTSGNGALMRLAAVPTFFHADRERAVEVARESSLLTHRGDESRDLAGLWARLCCDAIHWDEAAKGPLTARGLLGDIDFDDFECVPSVRCLMRSEQEDASTQPDRDWTDFSDRDWRWRADRYEYAPTRARRQPGYIGSYAMDAAAMSLHIVWSTASFEEAALKAANLRGDSDTVCAITCQLAGAIYGASAIPRDWVGTVRRHDGNGDITGRAVKLFRQDCLQKAPTVSE